jgi:pSer/pThr/pTyr-binding forkhead associated (FHA) protein
MLRQQPIGHSTCVSDLPPSRDELSGPRRGFEQPPVQATLVLEFEDKRLELGDGHGSLTIGRMPSNDVAISSPGVSRSHAKIEDRQGKFFLTDQSTNGTVVRLGAAEPLLLRREEVLLLGTGEIGANADADHDEPFPIRFNVSQAG